MTKIRVLLDACVLVPYQLADLLMRLADDELYELLWSQQILNEVERNLVKLDIPPEKAARRISQMRAAFPHAVVDGYEDLIDAMRVDPKDRHVAAAAVRGGAAIIVTANLKDFPPDTLAPYDIEPVHPDEFLLDQLDLAEQTTVECLQNHRTAYTRPAFTITEYYLALARTVPKFAAAASRAESRFGGWPAAGPLPIETDPSESTAAALFETTGPPGTTPMSAAAIWFTALNDRAQSADVLAALTLNPTLWGNFETAANMLAGCGMANIVERCPGHDDIRYIKFVPHIEQSGRAFTTVALENARILTMVLCPDGIWRAWGLTEHFPDARDIKS
ncbi:PIN domain-containing protein [Mycolicibacterium conceptionense]|uniref:PIN domain-containing protein n=1 Tax=Mycolicibacterium conceptionense TaxID=451644 RepID=UPI003204A96E